MSADEEMLQRRIKHEHRPHRDGEQREHPHRRHQGAGPSGPEDVEAEPDPEADAPDDQAQGQANPIQTAVQSIGEAAVKAVESKVADGANAVIDKVVSSVLKGVKL